MGFEVSWSACGTATVEAASAEEATKLVNDACMSFDDFDVESMDVDGCTTYPHEEANQ